MIKVLHSFQARTSLTTIHSAPAKPEPGAGDPDRAPHVPLSPPYLALQLERVGELFVLPGGELLLQPQQFLLQPQLLLLQMSHGGHHLLDHREGPGCRQAGAFPTAEPPSCSGSTDRAGPDLAASLGKGLLAVGRVPRGYVGKPGPRERSRTCRSSTESSDTLGRTSPVPPCRPHLSPTCQGVGAKGIGRCQHSIPGCNTECWTPPPAMSQPHHMLRCCRRARITTAFTAAL